MEKRSPANHLLLGVAFVGFISLGLPDAVIGVAWPSVRETFRLHQSALGLVLIGSGCGYFLSSFFSGRLLQCFGVGLLLALSTLGVAASGFGFAATPTWPLFVACAFAQGLGSGAIDAGLNGYGAAHFTARQMNWLHACYCLGAMLGPLLMTAVRAGDRTYRTGYALMGTIMLLLGLLFAALRKKFNGGVSASGPPPETKPLGIRHTLRLPLVWLQLAIFFLYTGLEVTVGQWSYTLFTEGRGVDAVTAGVWVSCYWGSIGVGRVLLGFVVDRIGIDRLLRLSLLTAVAGALLLALALNGPLELTGLLLIGFGLAPVFPCLMTRTPQRLGSAYAAHAIGFQVSAAMLGAAAIPSCTGLVVQRFGLPTMGICALGVAVALCALHEALLSRPPLKEPAAP